MTYVSKSSIFIQPEVLLLDEPCSSIDHISSAKIEHTIDEIESGSYHPIVTHNLQQAARVSNCSGFMYLAELIEFDTINRMFHAPRNPHTERFIAGRFG